MSNCPRCNGNGIFMVGHGALRGAERCPDCKGTGQIAPQARRNTAQSVGEGVRDAGEASGQPTGSNPAPPIKETPMPAERALDPSEPVMVAWTAYSLTPEYENSFKWAGAVDHRRGSMWAAFLAGFSRAEAALSATPSPNAGLLEALRSAKAFIGRTREYQTGDVGAANIVEKAIAAISAAEAAPDALEEGESEDPNKHPVWLDRKRGCQHCGAMGETAQWVDGPRVSDIRDLCHKCWPEPIPAPGASWTDNQLDDAAILFEDKRREKWSRVDAMRKVLAALNATPPAEPADEAVRAALVELLEAANRVYRHGNNPGTQWKALRTAIDSARQALAALSRGEAATTNTKTGDE